MVTTANFSNTLWCPWQCVNIEKLADSNNFNRQDYAGKHLTNGKACKKKIVPLRNPLFSVSSIWKKIIEVISENCECTPDYVSEDHNNKIVEICKAVGNYLCGYIYLKSLDRDCNRSLFVHVPPLNKPFMTTNSAKWYWKLPKNVYLRQVLEEGSEIIPSS